jgi:hypothetical protein
MITITEKTGKWKTGLGYKKKMINSPNENLITL